MNADLLQRAGFDGKKYAELLGHDSIESYQEFHGLRPDGVCGPCTETHMIQPRCGLPDISRASGGSWPGACRLLTAAFSMQLNVGGEIILDAWQAALRAWNSVCGIKLVFSSDFANAKIWATSGPLPGPTLAWSYLPTGNCAERIEQRYDTLVNWDRDFLAKVILHEVGHAIGLEHSSNMADIMYPSIQNLPFDRYPAVGDISKVVQLYGPPELPPPPGPPTKVILRVSDNLPPGTYEIQL